MSLLQSGNRRRPIARQSGTKWLKSAVTLYSGTLDDLLQHIPTFERRSFALAQPGGLHSRLNESLDLIVRGPIGNELDSVPVGTVSKEYSLIQHRDVVAAVAAALHDSGIQPSAVTADLELTEYGERMALSVYLPQLFDFDPGDGHPIGLRLECLNSVDGSTGFRALMGWFRFVCGNGLVIGVTRSDVRRRHVGGLTVGEVSAVLRNGLAQCQDEVKNFERWRCTAVDLGRLGNWFNDDVRRAWGFKAAARAYHIALQGHDVAIAGAYQGHLPTTIPVKQAGQVPGAPNLSRNVFDISQVLAWLARDRADLQEQLSWREQIPAMLKPLIPSGQFSRGL